jgi:hypothetical protein
MFKLLFKNMKAKKLDRSCGDFHPHFWSGFLHDDDCAKH